MSRRLAVPAVAVMLVSLAVYGQEETTAPALASKTVFAPYPEILVQAGTRIPLALLSSLSTKGSRAGDPVYLETVFPIFIDGRLAIPRGSYVSGIVTDAKKAGRVAGKSELYVRFDSLILPNGVTRNFRSRLGAADGTAGRVDRNEGKIAGDANKSGDAQTVASDTAVGSSVGALAGVVVGHPAVGLGVGAAAGAAAGLVAVLVTRGPDLILPKGTTVEMVLDRDLRFTQEELVF